jgi:DNA-binding PadR family transcriptional regulator
VSLGPLHGYGILLRIQQISKDVLQIQQGSLYPALYRPEHRRRARRGTGGGLT